MANKKEKRWLVQLRRVTETEATVSVEVVAVTAAQAQQRALTIDTTKLVWQDDWSDVCGLEAEDLVCLDDDD